MRVFDQQGNVIEVHDWQGNPLNDSIRSARVIEKRNGQFRMGPTLYWTAWAGVISGYVLGVALLGLSMLLWGLNGSLHTASSGPWACGIAGAMALVLTVCGNFALLEYYKRHGVPHRAKTSDKEMYCKKCQAKLEEELNVANEQRREELLAELKQLGVNLTPALEAAKDTVFEESGKVKEQWRPPREDPFDRGKR